MIVSVASGKGGTGKTLVATSLALAVSERASVQILDCDVEEPNANLFVHASIERAEPVHVPTPRIDADRCNYCGRCAEVCAYHAIASLPSKVIVFPELCHGCGACSYLCPESAIAEANRQVGVVEIGYRKNLELVQGRLNTGEPMSTPVIRKAKMYIDGQIDNQRDVIIDVAPGTSCPVVEAVQGSDYTILVTEPTPFGLNDLSLAVEMIRYLNIPCGVVINRSSPSRDSLIEKYCRESEIPVLLKIPFDRDIATLYSKGIPLVEVKTRWHDAFLDLFYTLKKGRLHATYNA